MAPLATLAHHSPGRARIRVAARRGDTSYFDRVRDSFSQCPGIRHLDVNPSTGSILLHHSLGIEEIVGFGRENELFDLEESSPRRRSPLARLGGSLRRLDQHLARSTGGSLDLATIAFVVFAGGAVVQLARGKALAPASTLAWYAASLLLLASALPRAADGQPLG